MSKAATTTKKPKRRRPSLTVATCATRGCGNLALPGARPRRCYYHTTDLAAWYESLLPTEQRFARGMFPVILEQHPAGAALYRSTHRARFGPRSRVAPFFGFDTYFLLQAVVGGVVGNAAWDGLKAASRAVWRKYRGAAKWPKAWPTARAYDRMRVAVVGNRPPTGRVTAKVRARVEALGRILLAPLDDSRRR